MALPSELVPTTCDVFRPFGAGSATHTNVPCRLVADFPRGRSAAATPAWTHFLVLGPTADVRDGCTRTAGSSAIVYADGDEVRIPAGAASPRFVVVWVETVEPGTPREFKRAYLVRHVA
jgi:hypothetical protein